MVHAQKRSPSADDEHDLKRTKRTRSSTTTNASEDPAPHFAPDLLSPHNIHRLNGEYATSEPYKYCKIEKLFQDELLKGVKDECLAELSFTEKETDIYKVCSY